MNTNTPSPHASHSAVVPYQKPHLMVRLLPLWIVLSALALVVTMVTALRKPPENKPTPDTARLVEVITAEPADLHFDVNTYGTVQPRTETTMVAEVSGQVVAVSPQFTAGGFLTAGSLLLQIDPSDYETALLSAEANLASRQAQLSQEQAQSEQARKDWERLNPGREPNALVLRLPQLDGAKAAVRSAQADVMKARRDLERTHIRIPYDGLVKSRTVDLGQYVTPGTAVGDVFAVDTAEIRLPLSDDDLRFVDLPAITADGSISGPEVTLRARVGGQAVVWNGRIVRTEGVVDTTSRMVYAVAQVQDPYGLLGTERQLPLKMGTFVQASIDGRLAHNVVQIPRSVLRPDNTLLIANDDNQLEVRPVTVARATPETAYISGGLAAGEHIITTSIAAPIPGIAVRTAGEHGPGAGSDSTDDAAVAEQALANSDSSTGAAR